MNPNVHRRRHRVGIVFVIAVILVGVALANNKVKPTPTNPPISSVPKTTQTASGSAATALSRLAIKGRAPMTGYSREQFGGQWADEGTCTMRDKVLAADMTAVTYVGDTCEVKTGTLNDPYTGKVIHFTRGAGTSTAVQIDHVVAIGDAWQTGGQNISMSLRDQLYNDPLELLAVDGSTNEQKGDGDAATWLPPNKDFRCRYVARQIAIKTKYHLWVTPAEHDAMENILSSCPGQVLPVVAQ